MADSAIDRDWPDLAGRLLGEGAAGGHVLPVRIYYEDTDFAGIVYHANYLRYFERARSDFLRLVGVDQMALHDGAAGEALNFAVAHMDIRFLAQAYMNDVLEIKTSTRSLTGARLNLDQTALRDGIVLCTARVEIALINRSGRPRRLPAQVRAALG
jgi:acyl-CoA thioester hydrolase